MYTNSNRFNANADANITSSAAIKKDGDPSIYRINTQNI